MKLNEWYYFLNTHKHIDRLIDLTRETPDISSTIGQLPH